jgi:hypothetical protein
LSLFPFLSFLLCLLLVETKLKREHLRRSPSSKRSEPAEQEENPEDEELSGWQELENIEDGEE